MQSPRQARLQEKIKCLKSDFYTSLKENDIQDEKVKQKKEKQKKERASQKKVEDMKLAALRFLHEKGPSDVDTILQGLRANIVHVYGTDDVRAFRNAKLILLHFLGNELDTRIGRENSNYFFVEGNVDRRPSISRKRSVVCIVDDSGLDQKMTHDEAVQFFKTKDDKFNPCSLHMTLRQNNGKKGYLMGHKVRVVLASYTF